MAMRKPPPGQGSLFDNIEPQNSPRYKEGDAIYRVALDVIESYVVTSSWLYKTDIYGDYGQAGAALWRYHLKNTDSNGGGVFGEYEMDGIWFDNYAQAEELALARRGVIEDARLVIRQGSLRTSDEHAFRSENADGKELLAVVARVGKVAVYGKEFYCYPFLYEFESEKKASKHYREVLEKISKESHGEAHFKTTDLYKAGEDKWSSYEYAERWGDWSCLGFEKASHVPHKQSKQKGRER